MYKKISIRDYNGVFICHELHTFHKKVYSIYDTLKSQFIGMIDTFGIYLYILLTDFLKLIFIFIELNMNEKQFLRKDKDLNIYQNYI